MLVFQHRLQSAAIIKVGDAVNGIEFMSNHPLGVIVPLWLYGSTPVDARGWSKGLPGETEKRIAFWYPRAFRYPDSCREDFRIDTQTRRIEIRDRFSYLSTTDDWHTKSADYAPVPPLAFFTRGQLFESCQAEARSLITRYGCYADRDRADTVIWSLPLPEPDLSLLPHTKGFPDWENLANRHFSRGVLFSAGGGTRYEDRNAQYPMGKNRPYDLNLNMHSSLMGMLMCTESPFIYSPENQQKMRQRLCVRLFEPLERYQYKLATRWREEPFSGIRYTIYMLSPRDLATKFAPGFGSKIIYGDSNETVQMILTGLQRAADRYGQKDLVRANWDVIKRQIASFPLAQDDWGYLASGCLEYGGPASIDMLNCEYSSMIKLARLAEIAGDPAMRAQALYRAARRMVPTIARLNFLSFAAEHRLVGNPGSWSISVGFCENGAEYRRTGAPVRDVELFDMSQGIPRDLLSLYRRYGLNTLRTSYLNEVRQTPPAHLDYILVAALAATDDLPPEKLISILQAVTANRTHDDALCGDWPGMGTGAYLEYVLHRLKGNPVIAVTKDLNLISADYDPKTKELALRFIAGTEAELEIKSELKLVAGQPYRMRSDGSIRVDVNKPGNYDLKIRFQ